MVVDVESRIVIDRIVRASESDAAALSGPPSDFLEMALLLNFPSAGQILGQMSEWAC